MSDIHVQTRWVLEIPKSCFIPLVQSESLFFEVSVVQSTWHHPFARTQDCPVMKTYAQPCGWWRAFRQASAGSRNSSDKNKRPRWRLQWWITGAGTVKLSFVIRDITISKGLIGVFPEGENTYDQWGLRPLSMARKWFNLWSINRTNILSGQHKPREACEAPLTWQPCSRPCPVMLKRRNRKHAKPTQWFLAPLSRDALGHSKTFLSEMQILKLLS